MDPLDFELRVIAAAEELARTLPGDPNHTVAAAALDTAGRIHTGVNVYHFTGGPCAELVALGAAAAAQAGPIVVMAAAGDGGRGLMPPCGRCRQVMLDLHPDVDVAVPTGSGPEMRSISSLLPSSFRHPDADALRVLRFNRRHYEAIVAGEKVTTVRWDEEVPTGPVVLYFEGDDRPSLRGEVLAANRYRYEELTPERLRLPAGRTVEGDVEALRLYYPDMPAEPELTVVDFRLD
jgi:cytidine deaminase